MPTYAYKCYDCGVEFEVTQKITEDPIKICESCGGENVKRQLFASPFQLKGTGWYKTDYASPSSGSTNHKSSVKKDETPKTDSSNSPEKKEAASSTSSAPSTPSVAV